MNIKKAALASIAFLFFTLILASCRTKGDTTAIITVRGNGNQAISDARVVVYGSGSEGVVILYDTVYTNSAGEAHFNFNDEYQLGQVGVAILDIEVKKDLDISQGIIKIEQETTNKETVYIGI